MGDLYPELSAPPSTYPTPHVLPSQCVQHHGASETVPISAFESAVKINVGKSASDFHTNPPTEKKSLACTVSPIVQPNFSMRSSLEFDWNNQIFGKNVWANPSGDSAGSVWKVSAFLVLTEKRSSCRHDTYLSWLQRAVFLSITIHPEFRLQAGGCTMPQNP